jgi:Ferritin-like domain
MRDAVQLSSDDLQRAENVLSETSATPQTRGWLLRRAGMGVAAGAALGPLGSMLGADVASARTPTIASIGRTAATAEALAVTYLSAVIRRAKASHALPTSAVTVLRAANRAELDHLEFLHRAGFRPLTHEFWIPDAFFGSGLKNVAPTLEVAETLFVNAYLIAITAFARRHQPVLARYAGEICAVEAQHLALARQLQGKLPNDLGFASYPHYRLRDIVAALEAAGVGFGKRGKRPGAFHRYQRPGSGLLLNIRNDRPD